MEELLVPAAPAIWIGKIAVDVFEQRARRFENLGSLNGFYGYALALAGGVIVWVPNTNLSDIKEIK